MTEDADLPENMRRVLTSLGGPQKKKKSETEYFTPTEEAALPTATMTACCKFTPEIGRKILAVIQAGNNREVACASVGISMSTLTHWVRAASIETEPFASFVLQMDQTEASLEAFLVAVIRQKAQEDPNLAMKLLERRFPQRWALGAPPLVNIHVSNQNQLTPADARAVMRDLFGDLSPKTLIEADSGDGK